MSTTTANDLAQGDICGQRGCGIRVYQVTLNAGKKNSTEVTVDALPATEAYDHEASLVAVQHTRTGTVGGKINGHRARGLLATGLVHRLHDCIGTRRH